MTEEPAYDESVKQVMEIVSKTIGFDMVPMKFEDIPKVVSETISKAVGRPVEIEGRPLEDGLTGQFTKDDVEYMTRKMDSWVKSVFPRSRYEAAEN